MTTTAIRVIEEVIEIDEDIEIPEPETRRLTPMKAIRDTALSIAALAVTTKSEYVHQRGAVRCTLAGSGSVLQDLTR